MATRRYSFGVIALAVLAGVPNAWAQGNSVGLSQDGRRLFTRETFGGNGRTCLTCHTFETGTVSPQDARRRYDENRYDPLFLHDGSDDGKGNGATRMLKNATVLVEIPLPVNVSLADDPNARSVVLRRGIPSTLNTPALDPVLMIDGREPNLIEQAANAIRNHGQSTAVLSPVDLSRLTEFELTKQFFSSEVLWKYARGGPAPKLPQGRTESEKRGKRFFDEIPPGPDLKNGLCTACHGGPMLNTTNHFLPPPIPGGARFQSIGVSEFNAAGNPVREFIFHNSDGTTTRIKSPDPGRALITGIANDPTGQNLNAFKIPTLWGVRRTAPYFHDNSAETLEQVAAHYARFFAAISPIVLTPQDQADIVAYMKLLE